MHGPCLEIVSVRIWRQCGFALTNSSLESGADIVGGIAATDNTVGGIGVVGDPELDTMGSLGALSTSTCGIGSLLEYLGRR